MINNLLLKSGGFNPKVGSTYNFSGLNPSIEDSATPNREVLYRTMCCSVQGGGCYALPCFAGLNTWGPSAITTAASIQVQKFCPH